MTSIYVLIHQPELFRTQPLNSVVSVLFRHVFQHSHVGSTGTLLTNSNGISPVLLLISAHSGINSAQMETVIQAYATCPDNVTPYLAEELRSLGAKNVREDFRVVYFEASSELYYELHFRLSLANRMSMIIKDVPAQSPEIIFDKTRRIRWHEYFGPDVRIGISCSHGGIEKIPSHLVGSKIREAVNDTFMHYMQTTPEQSSANALIGLHGFLNGRRLMLSLDTSGESLHRRGYRLEGHPAPLKENLADTLLRICEYSGDQAFYDPFCGSGTIAVEAARIAARKAPLLDRADDRFGLPLLKTFDPKLWTAVRKRVTAMQQNPPHAILASDISAEFSELTKRTAEAAGFSDAITVSTQDFFQTQKPAEKGLLVSNLPYGSRLDEKPIDEKFFNAVGHHLKFNFQGWRIGLLVPDTTPIRHLGFRPLKQVRLMNARIPVKFIVFEIYS